MSRDYVKIAVASAVITGGLLAWHQNRVQRKKDTGNTLLTDIIGGLKSLLSGGAMRTSDAGKEAIKRREGVRFVVYADSVGVLTGGIGHALLDSDPYNEGDAIPPEQVSVWFDGDISSAENIVYRYAPVSSLNQNQFDALVSVVFNTGSAFFRNKDGSQTHVSAYLDALDFDNAAAQFDHWIYAGGQPILRDRRMGEKSQFMGVA